MLGRDALPRVRNLSPLPADLTRSRTSHPFPRGARPFSQGKLTHPQGARTHGGGARTFSIIRLTLRLGKFTLSSGAPTLCRGALTFEKGARTRSPGVLTLPKGARPCSKGAPRMFPNGLPILADTNWLRPSLTPLFAPPCVLCGHSLLASLRPPRNAPTFVAGTGNLETWPPDLPPRPENSGPRPKTGDPSPLPHPLPTNH